MSTDRCPYSGLPITHPETFVSSYPSSDFNADFVKFGSNSSISAHYEFAITQDITISPEARIWFSGKNDLAIGARGDFYFDRLFKLAEPWDIWGGVDVGFVVSGESNKDDFDLNLHIGGEYKFNDMWGIILEIGGGTTAAGGIGVGIHF